MSNPTFAPTARQVAHPCLDLEKASRASERDFRIFFEMAGVGNVIADARSRRFLHVNRHFCEITGYSQEELRRMTADALDHPEDVERDCVGWEAVECGHAQSFTIEKRYRRKDGAVIWVEQTSTIVRDAGGKPLHAIGVVQDVSDRCRTAAQWEKARSEWERALLHSADRERQRIGQELHDHLCQHLLGAAFTAKALADGLTPASTAAIEAEEIARLLHAAVQQTRDIVRGLHSQGSGEPRIEGGKASSASAGRP